MNRVAQGVFGRGLSSQADCKELGTGGKNETVAKNQPPLHAALSDSRVCAKLEAHSGKAEIKQTKPQGQGGAAFRVSASELISL